MKAVKPVVSFLFLAVLILFTSQSAFGDCEVSTITNFLTVYPTATGTKLFGTLTIYYEQNNSNLCEGDAFNPQIKKMIFLVRMKKGNIIYGFSKEVVPPSAPPLCLQNAAAQEAYLKDFFSTTVVPETLDKTAPVNSCLKSVTQFVSDDQAADPGSPLFVTMDIELAVQAVCPSK